MKKQFFSNSLQEDLDALGIPGLTEGAMTRIVTGKSTDMVTLGESNEYEMDEDEMDEDVGDDPDAYDVSMHDPIDGPFVTNELFDRIEGLDLESIDEDGVEALIEGLSRKRIPNNVIGIMERAEQVAAALSEARKMIVWKGKRKKINVSKRLTPEKIERRRTYRRTKARVKRVAARRERKASSKIAAFKTARTHARLGDSFAAELGELLDETRGANRGIRGEIIEHLCSVIELIAEEFNDKSVSSVFEEAVGAVVASHDAGRLDEEVMEEESFMAEIRPVMALIHKSLERLDGGQGNVEEAICLRADAVNGGRVVRL